MTRHVWLLGVASVLLLPLDISAQSNATDAAIEGYVTDPGNGAVPNARVMVRNTDTNRELTANSNDAGYYRFPLLPIGSYELRVSADGFKEYRQSGISLAVGRQARADVRLEIGATQETVTVSADVGIVDSGSIAVGEVLPEQAVRTLPIVSRNLFNYNLLGPGVKGLPSSGFGTTQFTFGGLNRSTWAADGLDNSQRRFGRQIRLVIYTPEAIEETQVVASNYSAEFGRAAGGLVNVITRSGTNDYHGSLLFLYRPNETNARPSLAAAKPNQEWRTLAGTFGGPIVKDRLFFFTQYEHNPLVLPAAVTITPANARALGLSEADLADVPFGENFHTALGKINYRINDRNTGFIRYSRFTNDQPYGGASGLNYRSRGVKFEDRMNGGGAQLATVFSPTLLNEFRFGINRRLENRVQQFPAQPGDAFINIQGVANIGNNPGNNNSSIETSTQFIDNVTWTRGRHTMKAGIDYQNTDFNQQLALNRTFVFNGLAAAAGRPVVSPLDQYLRTAARQVDPATGRPYTYTQLQQDLGDPLVKLKFNFINFFVQDELRLTPHFTLNFGIRYERILFPKLDQEAPLPLSRRI
ncbi:MAG TPA: carboxypeptidase regulatory-like domain-containing protein, partial [Bryobacteraceae bacterium]|nr:carboxypeptidase regulatory-like domain-containing protein [Bryobacteraceae bacterium]